MLCCDRCGRDLNEIYQDNMSDMPGVVICEDCNGDNKYYPVFGEEY